MFYCHLVAKMVNQQISILFSCLWTVLMCKCVGAFLVSNGQSAIWSTYILSLPPSQYDTSHSNLTVPLM